MRRQESLKFGLFASVLAVLGAVASADSASKRFSMEEKEAIGFEVFMPKGDSGELRYQAEGTGQALITVRRCGPPTIDQSAVAVWHFEKLPNRPKGTDRAPSHQTGCEYGIAVQCHRGPCSGTIGVSSRAIGGESTTSPDNSTGMQPSAQAASTHHGTPLAKPGTRIADAGSQNTSAAFVPYSCRIQGHVRQGDYDSFAFDFPGGQLRAVSYQGLNLVADLIRATDGAVLQRHGVDTGPFSLSANVPAGRYIIQVRVMHHAGAGPYVIDLGQPSSCQISEAG